MLRGKERCGVIGTIDLTLSRKPVEVRRPRLVKFGALRLGEEFLGSVLGRALQGRVEFVGPDALQIGFTPRRFEGRLGWRRGLRRGLDCRHANDGARGRGGNGSGYDRA